MIIVSLNRLMRRVKAPLLGGRQLKLTYKDKGNNTCNNYKFSMTSFQVIWLVINRFDE